MVRVRPFLYYCISLGYTLHFNNSETLCLNFVLNTSTFLKNHLLTIYSIQNINIGSVLKKSFYHHRIIFKRYKKS